jgi:hypothetical protein
VTRSTTTPAMRRLAKLRDAAAARLREDLLHHLWMKFPQHCITLGELQARACVEQIIARGQTHGFTSLATLRGYAKLMVFLGSEFDEDPQLPWAGAQLQRSKSLARPDAIGELLSLAATQLARIAGREGEHYRHAILWARSKRFDQLTARYCHAGEGELHAWLHDLWPQKYEQQGKAGVAQLIADARVRASPHALVTTEAIMLYSGLMFLLGSAFARDPFHPWAALALARAMEDPIEPAARFHAAAVHELERFLVLDRIMRIT